MRNTIAVRTQGTRLIAAAVMIGAWMMSKAKAQQYEAGTERAARNLRKQGVPLTVALAVLAGRV